MTGHDETETPTGEHPSLRTQISALPYLGGLDGVRALAVVAVMIYHARPAWLQGGFLGVEVFFVISGYLITLLLIGEHERTGRVDLSAFWIRRARRLLPALFVLFGLVAVYLALFDRRPMGAVRGDLASGLLYVSNWYQLWVGQGYSDFEAFAPLRHLWSLAVEEQYYLLWPLVMVLILRKGRDRLPVVALRLIAIALAVTAAVAVLYVPGDIEPECSASPYGYWTVFGRCININETLYLSTVTRIGGLLLGGAFAMLWRPVAIMRGPLRQRGRRLDVVALVGLVVLIVSMRTVSLSSPADDSLFGLKYDARLFRGGFLLTGVCTLAIIAASAHRSTMTGRLLSWSPLQWLGTRSYGLYLFHWPVYQIVRDPGRPLTLGQLAVALAVTLPLTEFSYRVVEMPLRRRQPAVARSRRRARRAARGRVALASVSAGLMGFAAVSIATADVLCVGEVACSIEAGSVTTSSSPVTTTTVPNTSTTLPTDVDSTGVPTTVDPLAALPVFAIGESVMLGARPQLEAGGLIVNAEVSRQGEGVAEVVEGLRLAGLIGRTIVIQTGTNGSVSDEVFDRIMAQLPAAATPTVVFMTVKAPKRWVAENNARIRALPARYSNVVVLDWELGAARVEDQLSGSDGGVHLVTDGARQYYANLIFEAIGRPELKVA
ncbi:MAG: acyltransferase family protein [Ilumatobacteraceae bacterium]